MLYFCNKIKHRSTQSHDFVSMTVLTGFYASWLVEQSLLNLSDWRSHGFLLHLQKPIWVSVEFLSMFMCRNLIWQAPSLWPIFLKSYICLCLCIDTICLLVVSSMHRSQYHTHATHVFMITLTGFYAFCYRGGLLRWIQLMTAPTIHHIFVQYFPPMFI